MARRDAYGFSLVELLVALVFTMVLMAGMVAVFKTGVSTFYTSGEKISSMRRNRVTVDLLYDDLNAAGMSMVDVTSPLAASDAVPAFYIIPNATVANAGAKDPSTTDELYLAFDQPLPFDGVLAKGGGAGSATDTDKGITATQAVLGGATYTAGTDNKYVVNCGDADYAKMVKAGMNFHIKDDLSHAALRITSATPSGNSVTVLADTAPTLDTQVTGRGDSANLRPNQRIVGSAVVFLQPFQMIRYRIVMMKLDPDPANSNLIPCLVREQGVYNSSAFTPTETQIVAENVAGFKAYLKADTAIATGWAGEGKGYTGFGNGWTSGILAELQAQIDDIQKNAQAAAQIYSSAGGNSSWYRDIPVLLRADVTTRTAMQRSEYASTANTLDYKTFTQSLVMVPRHFGLTLK